VTVRILADREPYVSFITEAKGSLTGAFVVSGGPAALDEPDPDVVVLPAMDFAALASPVGRKLASAPNFIAYGPVALMRGAFEKGCVDYMREPWSLPELDSRLGKLLIVKFLAGQAMFRLSGPVLQGENSTLLLEPSELTLLRLLVFSAPLPVTSDAAMTAISVSNRNGTRALGRLVSGLRRKLETFQSGLGHRLHAIRGHGYRLDVTVCG
jgi:hypothetical protein